MLERVRKRAGGPTSSSGDPAGTSHAPRLSACHVVATATPVPLALPAMLRAGPGPHGGLAAPRCVRRAAEALARSARLPAGLSFSHL